MTAIPKRPPRPSSKNSDNPKKSAKERAEEFASFAIAAGETVRKMERNTRLKTYEIFAEFVRRGHALSKDVEAWRHFIELPFWSKVKGGCPRLDDRDEATRYLMRMHFGPSINGSKAASDWSLAADELAWDGIEPDGLVAALESKGGIAGVLKTARKKQTTGPEGASCKTKAKLVTTGTAATSKTAQRQGLSKGRNNAAVAYLDCVPAFEGRTDSGTEVALYATGILEKRDGRPEIKITWMMAYG